MPLILTSLIHVNALAGLNAHTEGPYQSAATGRRDLTDVILGAEVVLRWSATQASVFVSAVRPAV